VSLETCFVDVLRIRWEKKLERSWNGLEGEINPKRTVLLETKDSTKKVGSRSGEGRLRQRVGPKAGSSSDQASEQKHWFFFKRGR